MVKRYGLTLLLIITFIGVLYAVYFAMQQENQAFSYETLEYNISPRFREFYAQLGGENTLGIGISEKFEINGKEYQYVVAGLMRFDPSLPDGSQFNLSAIGNEFGITQSVYGLSNEFHDGPFRNGYPIYNEFVQIYYGKFEGPKFAGEPLTGPVLDDQSNRTLQYFENVGFYFNEADPEQEVHLLPFGVWFCKDRCLAEGNIDPMAIVSNTLFRDTFFDLEVNSYVNLAGKKLSPVRYATDGNVEQAYENIVLFADPGNLEGISLRPIASRLGYEVDIPVPPTAIDNYRFVFTLEDLGFHVNENVYEFLENNGGIKKIGNPIQQPRLLEEDLWRQCFDALCVEYRGNGSDIRMLPLGAEYYYQFIQVEGDEQVFLPIISLGNNDAVLLDQIIEPEEDGYDRIDQQSTIEIRTWVEKDLIPSIEEQVIEVGIFIDGQPVDGVNTEVAINMPGGIIQNLYPSITDNKGMTSLKLKPIDAPNGTRIEYTVCLLGAGTDSPCVQGDFLIWGNSP